jgi:hypothetical protein
MKLEKFALMAKNLNEEAAKRNIEVKETQAVLEKITSERNGLVSQVEMLKARVELYEQESIDYEKMRKEWENVELNALAEMAQTRKDQDLIIRDLSLRLELAIKTIETERRQQQQRRQIIFPASRQNSSLSGDNQSPNQKGAATVESTTIQDLEILRNTSKQAVRKYQILLESVMTQSAAREQATKDRVEALERELRDIKLKDASQCCSGERPLQKSSSTSSL